MHIIWLGYHFKLPVLQGYVLYRVFDPEGQ